MIENTPTSQGNKSVPQNPYAETEYSYSQHLQALPAAVYTCDGEGRVLLYNRAAVVLWGREPKPGKDLWCGSWRIYRPDGSALPLEECPMAVAVRQGKAVVGEEIIIERPDGVRRHVLPHPRPIYNSFGKVVQAVNMLVDITEYKKNEQAVRESEEKLRILTESLEKEVAERTRELERSNLELARSNSELEQFAYAASHDLQEPLRKIQAFTELLGNNLADENKMRYYIGKISHSSGRMMVLIKDLLNFSKFSNSSGEYVKVNLNEIISNVKEDFEVTIKERHASIRIAELPVIEGIALHIRQLFHNLTSNSLKFRSRTGNPEITISAKGMTKEEVAGHAELDDRLNYVKIEWRDNGIGFSQEDAGRIFAMFQRLNNPQAYEGTGIGLALCKKIIANHRGAIYAQSEENHGAVFHIILPLQQEPSAA